VKLLVVGSIAVLAAIIGLFVLMNEKPDAAPVAAGSASPSAPIVPKPHVSVPAPSTAPATVASSGEQRDRPYAPRSADMDRQHPGFHKAFRTAIDDNPQLRRGEMRCLMTLMPKTQVRFRTTLTFAKTSQQAATLTDVAFESDGPNTEALASCIKDAYVAQKPTLALPDSNMTDQFAVSDTGTIGFDPEPSPEAAQERIADLEQQLAKLGSDNELTPMIQDQLELYACYQQRHAMSNCL
jgi:hypothetical protein